MKHLPWEKFKSLQFAIGGFFEGRIDVSVEVTENGMVRRVCRLPMGGEEAAVVEHRALLEALADVHLERWKESYAPEEPVLDGTQWELEVCFAGEQVRFQGDNAYPENFTRLLEALGVDEEERNFG